METGSVVPADRVNDSILGALERPALAWMVRRLPPWVTPDHLTAGAFAGALITAAGFVLSRWSLDWLWLSCVGLLANWAGDSLDGTLARLRQIERPRYGFFVDQTSDLFGQVLVFLALGLSPIVRFELACLALISFLMAFVYTMIYAQVRDTFRVTYHGFGPTEIVALFFLGNLLTPLVGIVDLGQWITPLKPLGPVNAYELVIAILCLTSVLGLCKLALQEGRALAREDPAPSAARSSSPSAGVGS